MKINDKQFRADVKQFIRKHDKATKSALTTATFRMHKYAMHKAPVQDGNLKQQITVKVDTKGVMQGEVISNANYSKAVEEGTKPHIIRARNKKVLAGAKRRAPGGWNNFSRDWAIYGKKVKHPGTRGQPFMQPAFNVGRKDLMERLQKIYK
jgi:HK97 gp10 family phage protein